MSGHEIQHWLQHLQITAKTCTHNKEHFILLSFHQQQHLEYIPILKRYRARWSPAWKGWYIPRSKTLLVTLIKKLAESKGIDLQRVELKELVRRLELRSYSFSTIKNYTYAFPLFLDYYYPTRAAELNKREIEDYLLYLFKQRKSSETTIHTAINALKFYYEAVEKKPPEFYAVDRPQKPLLLPVVYSQNEIARILEHIPNLKHKVIIMAAYAGGLRASELINLTLRDIDSERMLIHIKRGKGKKDREVMLSPNLLVLLREYYRIYKPKSFLFEGMGGNQYSKRSINNFIAAAKEKAGIHKGGSHVAGTISQCRFFNWRCTLVHQRADKANFY